MRLEQISEGQLIAHLQKQPAGSSVSITVDVGATNTRVGVLTQYKGEKAVLPFHKFKVNNVQKLTDILADLEARALPESVNVQYAAINIPGPTDGTIGGPIANFTGSVEERVVNVGKLPSRFFPKGRTLLLNDLEAAAYGVLTVQELKMFSHYFKNMWKGASFGEPGHVVVVAPGTGLGAGLLHYHPTTKNHTVLPLEMGHINIASHNAEHRKFLEDYEHAMGRGSYPPEYDDVVSGRGLERLYNFHHRTAGSGADAASTLSAENISKEAKSGAPLAVKAMQSFNDYTMHFAGNMAMGFVPKTILLIGDNVVNNGFFYGRPGEEERMKAELQKHSTERMGFMSRVTLYRQVETINMNLLGCAFVCAHNSGQIAGEGTQNKKSSKL